jgi:hypothetical protein
VVDSLQALVTAGAKLTGTVLTLPGATAAEILAQPFDLVWVDLEHGALGPLDAQEMILGPQAARAAGVAFGIAGALDAEPAAAYSDASILVHSTDARLCASAVDGTAVWLREASGA